MTSSIAVYVSVCMKPYFEYSLKILFKFTKTLRKPFYIYLAP